MNRLICFVVFCLALCACSLDELLLKGPSDSELFARAEQEVSKEDILRGKHLAENIAICSSCHKGLSPELGDYSGGKLLEDSWGELYAGNITSDGETGVGDWSISELARAIKSSKRKNGDVFSLDVHSSYRWLSDKDTFLIATYVSSLEPVKNTVPKRELGRFQKKKYGFFSRDGQILGYTPSLPISSSAGYGRYLVIHMADCGKCHGGSEDFGSDKLAGGELGSSKTPVAGIRAGAGGELENWKEGEIVSHLERENKPSFVCPTDSYQKMLPIERIAIAKYLKSLDVH